MQYQMTPHQHGLGWVPDLPDQRDIRFEPLKTFGVGPIPKRIDLREQCPEVYDQGQLGSCTANALGAAFDFDRHKQGKDFMMPSRLFIYWNERDLEGTVESDAGAHIRDGVKVLRKLGTPAEKMWPYDIARFTEKPTEECYIEAEKNQVLTYQRISRAGQDRTYDMRACLAWGYPFVAGVSVYESFESDDSYKTGVIPMPAPEERLLGGHAILIVGFDEAKQQFIGRNSWGKDWGDDGYLYLPYDYLTNEDLSSDMWVLKTVELGA